MGIARETGHVRIIGRRRHLHSSQSCHRVAVWPPVLVSRPRLLEPFVVVFVAEGSLVARNLNRPRQIYGVYVL